MAASIWAKQTQATPAIAVNAFVRWLVETVSLYTIVEAYDADCVGANRRVPTPAAEGDLDNAAFIVGADFGWDLETLGVGDWIVLQSTNVAGQKNQVYIEYNATTSWKMCLMPKADFVTGGTDVTPPNGQGFPATAIGSAMGTSPTLVTFTVKATSMEYSAICDDSTIILICDTGTATDREMIYMGDVEIPHPDDVYPSVILDTPGTFYPGTTVKWNKVSHVDSSALLTGSDILPYSASVSLLTTIGADGTGGEWIIWPAMIWFNTASHKQWLKLKYTYYVHEDNASSGTKNTLAFMHLGSSTTEPQFCFTWDGATAYP